MANNGRGIETQITVQADTTQANQNLSTSEKLLQELVDTNKELSKSISDGMAKNEKAIKSSTEATKGLASGFKGVGLAFKAIGIGLILEAFNILKDLFMQNQKVADALGTATKALSIIFNDLFKFVEKSVGPISDFFKELFENPQEKLKQFGQLIKENLIERFTSFLDTLGYVSDGLKKLFTGDFKGATDAFKAAGKESIDVLTGVNNTVDRAVQGAKDLYKAGKEYLGNVIDQAAALQKMENAAKIAAAQNEKLLQLYDRQAEKLRQLRDDESATIADRIKANNELGAVLEKQAKVMSANAALVVQQAKNQLALNNTIDNQVALINAQKEAADVLATVEGFRSEQIVNRIALEKEAKALSDTIVDGEQRRAKQAKEIATAEIKDNLKRLEEIKKNIEAEQTATLEILKTRRDREKQGTQAYEDANQAFLDAQADYQIKLKKADEDIKTEQIAREKSRIQQIVDLANQQFTAEFSGFAERRKALEDQEKAIRDSTILTEAEKTAALKENTEARKKLDEEEGESKEKLLSRVSGALQSAASILGETTAAGKAAAIAAATIDTYQAAVSSYNSLSGIPIVGPALGAVAAGLAVASGIANVKKILSVKTPKGGGSGSSGGSAVSSPPAPPKFNVVGANPQSQLSETIAAQTNQPVQAYVVAGQVTTAQSLNRNLIETSTFG